MLFFIKQKYLFLFSSKSFHLNRNSNFNSLLPNGTYQVLVNEEHET